MVTRWGVPSEADARPLRDRQARRPVERGAPAQLIFDVQQRLAVLYQPGGCASRHGDS